MAELLDLMFTWFETAQAYSTLKNEPMANLATAELWYNVGDMKKALVFATRARGKLPQGGPDWQRASDIVGAAAPLAAQQRELVFGKVPIEQRQSNPVKGHVPGRKPRILPLIRH